MGYVRRTRCPKSHIGPMRGYFDPPTLVEQTRKSFLNSLKPFFVYGDLNIEKTWVTLCCNVWGELINTQVTVISVENIICKRPKVYA